MWLCPPEPPPPPPSLSPAGELGLNVAVLDGDISVQRDFYPAFKSPPLAGHNLIYTLDHAPTCGDLNVGFAYCQNCRPKGRAQVRAGLFVLRFGCVCGGGGSLGGFLEPPRHRRHLRLLTHRHRARQKRFDPHAPLPPPSGCWRRASVARATTAAATLPSSTATRRASGRHRMRPAPPQGRTGEHCTHNTRAVYVHTHLDSHR